MFPLLTCGKQQRSSDSVERLCFEEGNIEEEKMDNGSTMTHKMIGSIYTKCFTGTQIKKMYLDVLDFHMMFCLHLTVSRQITSIWSNVILCVFSVKNPIFDLLTMQMSSLR